MVVPTGVVVWGYGPPAPRVRGTRLRLVAGIAHAKPRRRSG